MQLDERKYLILQAIVKTGGIQACLDYYERISESALQEIKSMLVFDAVIYNEDRHFGNLGILRDNHTGKLPFYLVMGSSYYICAVSPIFLLCAYEYQLAHDFWMTPKTRI